MRRALIAALLAGAVAVSATTEAQARWGWRGGWGWGIGAFAIGALLGAALWRATATATRPTATVMAIRPMGTAAITGRTTARTMPATIGHTTAIGSCGGWPIAGGDRSNELMRSILSSGRDQG
jgi:hypothetical protein